MAFNDPRASAAAIVGRLESLPFSSWDLRIAASVGAATFFDAFDSLTIAFILPSLIHEWHLTTFQAAALVSVGYAGQAVGAVVVGALAERYGRVPALVVAIGALGICSLICASTQTFMQLLLARFAQGIGLGGEVPVAAAYLSEMIRFDRRGKVFMLYQSTFGIGITAASIAGSLIVPSYGWRAMFLIGCVPAALAVVIARICPESPRWLADNGQLLEADRVMSRIESQVFKGLKPPTNSIQIAIDTSTSDSSNGWATLFSAKYFARTVAVCALWITAYACTYAITIWIPTLLTHVYGLGVKSALNLSVITSTAGSLGIGALALFVDRVTRRLVFFGGFAATVVVLLTLAALVEPQVATTIAGVALAMFFLFILTSALYLYTPELYPTRVRALGTGFASFCLRVTAIGTPFGMGVLLQHGQPVLIFLILGSIAGIGALVSFFWVVDTRGRSLEETSR